MKRIINTPHAPGAIGPYSQAVEVNGMLFVSGQIALDPATGELCSGGTATQTEQVCSNLKAILIEAGYTFADVVKTTVLLANMDDFAAMNVVYAKYFTKEKPARAAFQAAKLPRGANVEIELIAVKPSHQAPPFRLVEDDILSD
ncbi:reactive intermediate/imine deaminase [Bacteroidia bacterium]|nr:reactive intermediate/imine deaminase [Bacteroidia bacterium]